jgi:hypothetical protein
LASGERTHFIRLESIDVNAQTSKVEEWWKVEQLQVCRCAFSPKFRVLRGRKFQKEKKRTFLQARRPSSGFFIIRRHQKNRKGRRALAP